MFVVVVCRMIISKVIFETVTWFMLYISLSGPKTPSWVQVSVAIARWRTQPVCLSGQQHHRLRSSEGPARRNDNMTHEVILVVGRLIVGRSEAIRVIFACVKTVIARILRSKQLDWWPSKRDLKWDSEQRNRCRSTRWPSSLLQLESSLSVSHDRFCLHGSWFQEYNTALRTIKPSHACCRAATLLLPALFIFEIKMINT